VIEFTVYGTPSPQGSKTTFAVRRKDGKGGHVYTGKVAVVDAAHRKLRPWRDSVKTAAQEAMTENGYGLILGPVTLAVTITVARPAGHFGTGRNAGTLRPSAPRWPAVRPDGGKYQRAIEDALKHTVWRDDSQVVSWSGMKLYAGTPGALGEPGCQVQVWELWELLDDLEQVK
jgi:crossover junction endodeoxyribonuclease RusA